ncbi:hypothetical protein O1R50_14870 [Glycomyces luteolus]|uniref:Uncharacterized protein n=1 Tax=Glycomyces luteolus TaxID=2670330 RepID=A0A9X3SR48_9ACTN|nr:hypothetical protein [Glycomyces luteolus]MDA1360911.1 hypothetical protein [Glycomyces luteolus]
MNGSNPDDAAEQMAEAIDGLRPTPGRLLIVARGVHPVWTNLADRCRLRGWTVVQRTLAVDDRRWAPPVPDGLAAHVEFQGERIGCDLVVYHDPFGGNESQVGGPVSLRRLCGGGIAFVSVDFPHGLADPVLAASLEAVYLRALATPVAALRDRADRLASTLADADSIEVHFGDRRVLHVRGPWNLRTDFGSAQADLPILQLPLGEVWIACRPESVRGDLEVQDGPGVNGPRRFTVEEGRLREPRSGRFADLRPVVEIGFGVNPDARWLPMTSLGEKAAGSMHVGFGDNVLIGGDVADDRHYDLPLPRSAQVKLMTAARGAEAVAL